MSQRGSMGLIGVPALITLGVTLLRLAGELLDWSPTWFNRAAGGGASPVGIIWLVPVFGAYFALALERGGHGPASLGRAFGRTALGIVAFVALAAAGFGQPTASPLQFTFIGLAAAAGILAAWGGWPELSRALFGYGLLARIPVAVVVLLAVLGGWNTHYDNPPAGLPALAPFSRWIAIGLIPQLTVWMAVTVLLGGLAGAAAVALLRRGASQPAPAR